MTMHADRGSGAAPRAVIRAAARGDAASIARVHVDAWRSTYAGIVPQTFLDELSYARREAFWAGVLDESGTDHGLFVAQDPKEGIIGFAHGAPERPARPDYAGELYAIYVLKAFQGRGVGRDLVLAVVDWFIGHGIRSMLVWVLVDNPSRRFYERMGGRQLDTKRIDLGGAALDEVAYGWSDVTTIRAGAT